MIVKTLCCCRLGSNKACVSKWCGGMFTSKVIMRKIVTKTNRLFAATYIALPPSKNEIEYDFRIVTWVMTVTEFHKLAVEIQ